MKLVMMAIKDRALNAFMQPFFAQSINQAIRSFQDELNNPQSPMNKHPDDYDLWHLGTWDDGDGKMSEQEEQGQVAIGKNMIHK